MAGLVLDDWQAYVLAHSLGEKADGDWAAFEVGIVAPRQNGKDAILEARELAGLFLLGERLIVHTAHLFDTSQEHFRRLCFLIEDTPELDRRVKKISQAHGKEGIELLGGQRIRFRTRTKGGGRGWSGDLVVMNEAMDVPEATLGALMPTLSARPNPQIIYAASAVDQVIHEHGLVLSRVRHRAIQGDAGGLAYFEWSAGDGDPADDNPELLDDRAAAAEETWARANPALDVRIGREHVALERAAMDRRTFAVERLNVGDWPRFDGTGGAVIDMDVWDGLADPGSRLSDPVVFAFDVSPDRSWASIAAAGANSEALPHVEVIDRRRGTGWVVGRMAELAGAHTHKGIVCDGAGPAGSLLPDMADAGLIVAPVTAKEHAQACGRLVDAVAQRMLRHLGSDELRSAVRGASQRPLGDSWAWSRRSSAVDIAPLVACTLALGMFQTVPDREPLVAFA
jgi:hypothetical protein